MRFVTSSIATIPADNPCGSEVFSQIVIQGDIAIVWADLNSVIERNDWNIIDLSDEENRRAEGYVREEDRQRFVQRRRILRHLLGEIFCREPRDIVLRTDVNGKPFVDPVSVPWPVSFSLSHSRDRVVFAFVRNRQIGIDIEYRDPLIEVMKMADVFCTHAELERLRGLPSQEQLRAFYDCWCAKEAFIKAVGVHDPKSFEISFYPQSPRLLRIDNPPADLMQWSFQRFDMGVDWAAMLAVEGRLGPIKVYQNPLAELASSYCKSLFALLRDPI